MEMIIRFLIFGTFSCFHSYHYKLDNFFNAILLLALSAGFYKITLFRAARPKRSLLITVLINESKLVIFDATLNKTISMVLFLLKVVWVSMEIAS